MQVSIYSFYRLLRPELDVQADAGDVAVRAAAAGLLAVGKNFGFRISDLKKTTTPPGPGGATLNPQLSTFNQLLFEKIPFFVLAGVASVVTFMVQKHTGAVIASEIIPLGARSGNALVSYCRYLGKLFWPADLAIFYPHPGHCPAAKVLLAALFLCGTTVFLFLSRRRYPFLLTGWLWYLGTLVPVIGLVQAGEQAMADRYTYIPSLGLLLMVVWGLCELTRSWRWQWLALSMAGIPAATLCLGLTRHQLGYWRDSETLFRHTLAATRNNHVAHFNLGNALAVSGHTEEAIRQYQEAIRLQPPYALAHYNLGNALHIKGQTDLAIRQYEEAIRLQPDYAPACNNLGFLWASRSENLEQASALIEKAGQLAPGNPSSLDSLGWVLYKLNRPREALDQLLKAAEKSGGRDPSVCDHLGDVYAALHQRDQAAAAWRQALALEPNPVIQKKLDALGAF